MRRFAVSILSRPWLILLVIPTAAIVALLFGRISDAEQTSAEFWSSTVFAILLLSMFGIALLSLLASLAGIDPQSTEIAGRIANSELKQQLLERWLKRSRHYRFVGATVGFIIGIGFTENGDLSRALFGLFCGIAIGGAFAELHVLSGRKSGARSAELTSRRLSDYTAKGDTVAMGGIAVVSIATIIVAFITTPPSSGRPLFLAVVALVIVVLARALQYIVTTRPRPAVSKDLRDADDLLRRLAATQGFARPAIAVALMALAVAVADLGTNDLLDLAAFAIGLAGVIWYVRSRQAAILDIARASEPVMA